MVTLEYIISQGYNEDCDIERYKMLTNKKIVNNGYWNYVCHLNVLEEKHVEKLLNKPILTNNPLKEFYKLLEFNNINFDDSNNSWIKEKCYIYYN